MESFSARSVGSVILSVLVALFAVVILLSFALIPRQVSAAAVGLVTITATSTNLYTNTGLATTTRVATGDDLNFQLTLDGTPLVGPEINIFGMGSTTMSGAATDWYYATTTTNEWTEGFVTFQISVGDDIDAQATTTVTNADLTGTNATFDKAGPTLVSVSWSDIDGSTQFSATDTLTLTFSETMATSTITSGNVDTTLALSGNHTFGASPTLSWNTAGTILTLTLGTAPTLATADTIDPTTDVKDAVGNSDTTSAPLAITDNVAPGSPTGLSDTSFRGAAFVSLASAGSSQIRYTTDGTTPDCSTGTVYTSAITIGLGSTLKAIGCDEAGNGSSVVTAVYTYTRSAGGGGSSTIPTTPATPAIPHLGLTSEQVTSILTVLASFGADSATIANVQAALSGTSWTTGSVTSTAVQVFKANLTTGSLGSEVKALQEFLNARGYTVASSGPGSPGNETANFGGLTRAALVKYQKAKGITPAVGYFGPLTRTAINAEQ